MDRKLRKILTECIRDIETGALDVEGCLQRHPDRAAELRPHLELWSGLNAAGKAQPNLGGQRRGQQQLLAALADMEKEGGRRMIPFLTPALAKAAAVVAGVALLAAGTAGASAALGGPDVADEVLSSVGMTSDDFEGGCQDLQEAEAAQACQAVVETAAGACAEIADEATLALCEDAVDAAEENCDHLPSHAAQHACENELESVEDTAEETLDALEEANDEAEDALEDANEEAEEALEDANDEAEDALEEALDDDDIGDDAQDNDDDDSDEDDE